MAARQFSVFVPFCFLFVFFAINTSSKGKRCRSPIGGDSYCPPVPEYQHLIYCWVCDLQFGVVFCLIAVVFLF